MDRLDPLQRRGSTDASFREVVDWDSEALRGVVLRHTYPAIAWIAVFAGVALAFWLFAWSLKRQFSVVSVDQRSVAIAAVSLAVVLTLVPALVSTRSLRRGPPVGAVLSSDGLIARLVRLTLVLAGTVVLVVQIVVSEFVILARPLVVGFVALSVLPALGLVVFIRRADVTSPDPSAVLLFVFVLGILLANIAAIVNTAVAQTGVLEVIGDQFGGAVAISLFFVLVVAPGEELVKLLAGGLYTYRSEQFDAVAAGAVYGAVAGLGFATIENAIYIAQEVAGASSQAGLLESGGRITVGRAFAGPGHVIWSGIAGYYLGLARFNSRFAGVLVCKGLLIAVVLHAVYNISVQFLLIPVARAGSVSPASAFVTFAVAYHGLAFGYLLYKVLRYRDAHRDALNGAHIDSELAEFDP
jgi:RsiW-degrading membrane proteinase PrsW (M82 family)